MIKATDKMVEIPRQRESIRSKRVVPVLVQRLEEEQVGREETERSGRKQEGECRCPENGRTQKEGPSGDEGNAEVRALGGRGRKSLDLQRLGAACSGQRQIAPGKVHLQAAMQNLQVRCSRRCAGGRWQEPRGLCAGDSGEETILLVSASTVVR
jgi:hypothetical protein